MTIMAGVFSRSHTQQPPTALCDQIRSLLSRHPTDKVHEFIDDCIWMAKIDIEAFGVAGYHRDPDGSISMLTGDPLLDDGGLINRYASLETLHRRLIANDYRRTTARTRGSFCMACYAPNKQLILITDRLGLRSMYVAVYDNIVIFATAFRIFKALRGIQKSPDLMSLTEICTYGVPLGDRSEFLEIKRLLPSEIVVINQEYIRRSFYWRWDSIKPISREDFVETLYREFKKSVILRLMEDRTVLSFLSGGLDSRSIVAVLVGEGARVHTMGLGNRNGQDGALAPKFAEAIGSHHIQCDTDGPSEGEWWERVAKAVTAVQRSASPFSPERPRLVWNGEGGSVCLGHVHLTQRIVDLCRGDDRTAFLREFASYNSWLFGWQRVMRRSWWKELSSRVKSFISRGNDPCNAH